MKIENTINPDLTFGLLKGKAKAFVNGEITQEELNEWGDSLIIINSMPLLNKMEILMDLVTKYFYSNTDQQEFKVVELYRNIFFVVYLKYLGVEIVYPEDLTYENYDLMEPLYGPWIEMAAGRDIQIIKDMLRDSINMYNINDFMETLENIDSENLKIATQENKKVFQEISHDKELVQNLKDLVAYNNPTIAKAVEELRKIQLEKILEQKKEAGGAHGELKQD